MRKRIFVVGTLDDLAEFADQCLKKDYLERRSNAPFISIFNQTNIYNYGTKNSSIE